MTPTPRDGPAFGRLRPLLIPLLGYVALTALFYAPVLLGRQWFTAGDFSDHFLPFSLFQRSELLAGRLPVWNPYTFSGHPFLADVQAAVFYPVSNLVLALTLPWGGIMARLYWLQVEAILQIALGGFFVYLLVRDLVANPRGAFLAGCVFAFSGYLTGYPVLQTAILRTAIWLPLILWCLRRAFHDARRWRWWVAAAVAYAIAFLGGHPQTFLYLTYCMLGWLALLAVTTPLPRRTWLPKTAAFFVLFLGLSAAQLWPSLEFAALSVRAQVDYAFVSGGFQVRETLQMLVPGVITQFSPLYVGLIALGLALLACAAAFASRSHPVTRESREQAATVLFFALVAVLALLASYGGNGPLYPILYRFAPGWSYFRGQERSAYLVTFALSVLAGYGAVAWERMRRRTRAMAGLGWTVAAAALLLAFAPGLAASANTETHAALLRGAAVGLTALLVAAVGSAFVASPPRRTWLLTLLILVELFAGNMALNWSARPTLPSHEALAVASAAAPADPASVPHRAQNDGRLPEDYGMLAGVEDVSGSSPLRLARYDALLKALPPSRLWQLTGVGTVLNWVPAVGAPARVVEEISTPESSGYVHSLAEDFPRAWVVNALRTAADDAALDLLADGRLDLHQTAVLPPDVTGTVRPLGLEDGVLAPGDPADVRLERRTFTDLRLAVKTDAGGYLVVSENWMPGWQAMLTSAGSTRPASVLRTDLTFLGLAVPPGDSMVELRYRPLSVRLGLLISMLTLLLLAVATLAPRLPTRIKTGAVRLRSRAAARWAAPLVALVAVVMLAAAAFGVWNYYGGTMAGKAAPMRQVAAVMQRYAGGWPANSVRAAQVSEDAGLWHDYGSGGIVLPASGEQAANDYVKQLAQQDIERVVLAVRDAPSDNQKIAQQALAAVYELRLDVPVAGWRVQTYDRSPAALDPANVEFANGVRLTGMRVAPDRATPGDILPIYLQWQAAPDALTGNEKLSLQLLDASGKLATQLDQPFAAASQAGQPVRYELQMPRLVQPGPYTLIAALYDPGKDGAPRLLTTDGADHVTLKAFAGP